MMLLIFPKAKMLHLLPTMPWSKELIHLLSLHPGVQIFVPPTSIVDTVSFASEYPKVGGDPNTAMRILQEVRKNAA